MSLAPEGVRTMFDRIAPVYDVMNRVMTAGLDVRWRRLAAESVVRPGDRVLDAACGTGDLAIADKKAGAARVTGLDFSQRMLERARRKADLEWVEGDMLALPFAEATFDAATVGFGVRNVADLELGLRSGRARPRGWDSARSRDHEAGPSGPTARRHRRTAAHRPASPLRRPACAAARILTLSTQ